MGVSARPRRLAIIGCGRVVEWYHLPALAYAPEWQLAAACDTAAERRAWLSRTRPGIPVFASFEALLLGSRIDAVLIATPPATHARLTRRALEAGLHVLVENPLGLSPKEADSLADMAAERELALRVGFNRRFRPPYVEARERLRQTPAARIRVLHSTLIFETGRWGEDHGAAEADARGEGVLDHVASHQIDLLTWMADRPLVAVRAVPGAHAYAVHYWLRFADGLVASCYAGHGERYREQLDIKGADGRFIVTPASMTRVRGRTARLVGVSGRLRARAELLARRLTRTPTPAVHSLSAQLRAFAAAVSGDSQAPGAGAEAGRIAVAAIAACRESLATGGAWCDVHLQQKIELWSPATSAPASERGCEATAGA